MDADLTSGSGYTVLGQSATAITRDGYTFKSWNTASDGSGTAYAPGEKFTIAEDITLYAQWEKIPDPATAYKVTYDANGGTGGYSNTNLASGSDYTVKSQATTEIIHSGYTFTGWNTKADGDGDSYAAGDVINITEDVTLYSQWKNTSSGSTTGSDTSSSPKTGDDGSIGLWIVLLEASFLGVVGIVLTRKRKLSGWKRRA